MHYFAAIVEKRFDLGRVVGAVNLVKEFERTIFRELDMLVEAGNIERFTSSFEDIEELVIPRVFWRFTSRSVLVMEHIDGIKMDQVAEIRRHGIDPREVAMIGLRSFSRQLMQAGIFHADPHPGNTIVMPDGRVGLVDFRYRGLPGRGDDAADRQPLSGFRRARLRPGDERLRGGRPDQFGNNGFRQPAHGSQGDGRAILRPRVEHYLRQGCL
jgi:predicted unusual protein kinase regulating ubiquinone biosynthesis (AarF/ABC1/UbiB family)